MLYTILQTLALVLTLESAIFLIRGNIILSAQSIAELSGAYWDFNPHLVQTLSRQTVDTRIGSIQLIGAFLVQILTLWKGPTLDDLGPADLTGLFVGTIIGIIVFGVSWWCSSVLSKKVASEVEGILKAKISNENTKNN